MLRLAVPFLMLVVFLQGCRPSGPKPSADPVVDVWIEALEQGESRELAANALGFLGPRAKHAAPHLLDALVEEVGVGNLAVARAVAQALSRIPLDPHETIPKMITAICAYSKVALSDPIYPRTTHEFDQAIAKALSKMGPSGVPLLMNALWDDRHVVRAVAIEALGEMGLQAKAAIPVFIFALRDPEGMVRMAAASAIGKMGSAAKDAVPDLISGMKNTRRRGPFDHALQKICLADSDSLLKIIRALSHEEKNIRARVIAILGELEHDALPAIPALINSLKDQEKVVRKAAAMSLGRMGSVARVAGVALATAMQDKESMVRHAATVALGKTGPKEDRLVKALAKALKDPDGSIREAAAKALGVYGPKAHIAVPALKQALGDRHWEVIRRAAWALGRIGPAAKEAIPTLAKLLRDEDDDVRECAAAALGEIGVLSAVVMPALIEGLQAEENEEEEREGPFDPYTPRMAILTTLKALGPQAISAIPALLDIAVDRDLEDWFRELAIETIGVIGPKAKSAIPPLKKIIEKEEGDLREAAKKSLASIQSPG